MEKTGHASRHSHYLALLQHGNLFAGLSEAAYAHLATGVRAQRYKKHEVIFHAQEPGNALFLLTKGVAKVSVEAADRREVCVRLLTPPEYFGDMALLDGLPRSATVSALEAVEVLVLAQDTVTELLAHAPQVAMRMVATLGRRLRHANDLVRRLVFLDAHAKVAHAVSTLSQEHEDAQASGARRRRRVTQGELAARTGLARQTVARVLGDLEQAGYLRRSHGALTILEPARLARLAPQ